MAQNAFDQSDCSIFKSTKSLEQNDEKAWFFAYWYRFMENRIWLKNIGVAVVKMGVATLFSGLSNWLYVKEKWMK